MYPEDRFEFAREEEDRFDLGLFLAGLLTGAAIGAGVALLLAPQSGEESRRYLHDTGTMTADRVKSGIGNVAGQTSSTLGEAKEKVSHRLEDVKHKTTDSVDTAKSAVEDWVHRAKETIDETRQRLDEAVEAGRVAYADKKTELDAQVDASLET